MWLFQVNQVLHSEKILIPCPLSFAYLIKPYEYIYYFYYMQGKAGPNVKLHGLISPCKILNSLSRVNFYWFNRIHFKLILLTLLFKSLFNKINLNCSYSLLLDVFSVIMPWGFFKYVISKNVTNIFNKSTFANKKLIVIII